MDNTEKINAENVNNEDVSTNEESKTDVVSVNESVNQEAKEDKSVATTDLAEIQAQLKQRDDQISDLKKQLEDAIKLSGDVTILNDSVKQLTTDLEAKQNKVSQYEDVLKNVLESKMNNIPDQFKALIPESMSLVEKVAWLDKAEATGIFTASKNADPEIEIGKPMNVEIPKVDTSKLSGSQLLKMAFNTVKG